MDVRRETRLGLSVLLVVEILLCMLSISLLTRMGPAIERILEENVYSVEAVEEMISIMALADGEDGEVPEAFEAAHGRIRDNVTEAAEKPLVEQIDQDTVAAFAGDAAARARVVASLRELGDVNRLSMRVADDRAQRLGQTGAWAAVLLGASSLAVGILVYRRLRLRLELPLEDIRRTLRAVRNGNRHARCGSVDGPAELEQIAEDIDWMLDHSRGVGRPERGQASAASRDAALRRALDWMGRRHGDTVLLLDANAKLVFGDLEDFQDHEEHAEAWQREALAGTSLTLAYRTRRHAEDAPA